MPLLLHLNERVRNPVQMTSAFKFIAWTRLRLEIGVKVTSLFVRCGFHLSMLKKSSKQRTLIHPAPVESGVMN
jgi:hypothetical protein